MGAWGRTTKDTVPLRAGLGESTGLDVRLVGLGMELLGSGVTGNAGIAMTCQRLDVSMPHPFVRGLGIARTRSGCSCTDADGAANTGTKPNMDKTAQGHTQILTQQPRPNKVAHERMTTTNVGSNEWFGTSAEPLPQCYPRPVTGGSGEGGCS